MHGLLFLASFMHCSYFVSRRMLRFVAPVSFALPLILARRFACIGGVGRICGRCCFASMRRLRLRIVVRLRPAFPRSRLFACGEQRVRRALIHIKRLRN
jgi:hypothetical protein